MRTRKTKNSRSYRFRVELQEKTSDEWNKQLRWTSIGERDVDIRPITARIAIDGVQETVIVKYEILMPWEPDLFEGIIERRFVHEENEYYVESVIDLNSDHREYRIACTRV